MKTFRQLLAGLHLTPEQVNAVCFLIETEIIGEYEKTPIPEFSSAREVGEWTEKADIDACRNGLRKEQLAKVKEIEDA